MDGSLLNIRNNSNSDQEIDLFNSSDQGGSALILSWTFDCPDMNLGANEIYNVANAVFFDQTVSANPGTVTISYITPGGGSASKTITGLEDVDLIHMNELLNDAGSGDTYLMGTWTVTMSKAGSFLFQLEVSKSFEDDIDSDNSTKGAEAISFTGTGFTTYSLTASSEPRDFFEGLASNKNIQISGFTDFTYNQLLYSVVQRTYDIKKFEVYSSNQNQLLEPFLFDRKLATGRVYQKVITPTIDPYQQQKYVITPDKAGYILDGFTKLKYKVLASSSVRLLMLYNYIDVSTPLIVEKKQKLQKKYFNQSGGNLPPPGQVSPSFMANMANLQCGGLNTALYNNQQQLNQLQSAGTNPNWQQMLQDRVNYINNLLTTQNCTINPQPQPTSTISVSPGQVSQAFQDNMDSGYQQFGCNFLKKRLAIQEEKLNDLSSAGTNPKWQQMLNDKIDYIKDMIAGEDCSFDDLPQFSQMGELYQPKDLFIPTNDFIQHQIDTEEGASKLLEKPDFPMDLGHNF